jgi:hypothetical protein
MGTKGKRIGVWLWLLKLIDTYEYYEGANRLNEPPRRRKSTHEEERSRAVSDAVARVWELPPKDYIYAIVKATSR